ncbi:MAG: hypothetical protein ACRD4R_14130 [Candidatus Acidiferrales bacterium]
MLGFATPKTFGTLRLKHLLGLDGAIAYTVLARLCNIVGSTGTVLLIVHFLSPVEQGYYYTILGLVALQTVFELGLTFVILQMAAHECIHLVLRTNGDVEGDPIAHARLASVLRQTVRWYLAAAAVLWIVLLPFGLFFFSLRAHKGIDVAWHGPWIAAVSACALMFLLDPLCSFLEGCGQVRQVANVRFWQALAVVAMSWTSLITRHGLYAPAMIMVGYAGVAAIFLWTRRKILLGLMRYKVHGQAVSWRKEIWPFQWQIAVSSLCAYFTMQVFTPLLFAFRGPVEAGQMGMSLSIAGYLSIVALSWMSTKAAPFGQMVSSGRLAELRDFFFRTVWQSSGVFIGLSIACEAGIIVLYFFLPRLAARMLSPWIFGLLILATGGRFAAQSMAIYLRSFKREPFLVQSTVVASLTLLFSLLVVRTWGSAGLAFVYLACTGIVGVVLAVKAFRSWESAGGVGAVGTAKAEG